ncbi:MAG: hypothetical protein GEV03_01865 [Streptosporangiales bacterium]|nr:hypothetical protein [Streptosporangiales bacterium]
MINTTWRTSAGRLVVAALVAAGAALAFSGVGAAETTPSHEPSPATGPSADAPADSSADTTADGTAPSPPVSEDQRAATQGATRNGDNGTVKVHRSTTPPDDRRNEPKVCEFYLVGFGFDARQQVRWWIRSWPPTGDREIVDDGTLTLDENGHGRTGDMTLPDGHYKLFWKFAGEKGRAKQKVFWVDCPTETTPPTSTPTPSETSTPSGTPSTTETPAGGAGAGGRSSDPPTSGTPTGALPFTGFSGPLLAGLGLALLIGGTALVIAARRGKLPGLPHRN